MRGQGVRTSCSGASRSLANVRAASAKVTALAVEVALALHPDQAWVTAAATAIHVGFVAIGAVVQAWVTDASELECVAGLAHTIGVDHAALTERATWAETPATIGVGFVAILVVVLALRRHARERHHITRERNAVGIG